MTNKTITVFNELSNIYGAAFNKVNGNVGGEVFKQWQAVVELMALEDIAIKLDAVRAMHLIEVDKCKYIKPVSLADFQSVKLVGADKQRKCVIV